MAPTLLLSIQEGHVTFGGKPLFDELALTIHEGDRISLVGKNGAGKTTLMQSITGARELDGGKRWSLPGLRIGHLQQDIKPKANQSVRDFVTSSLPKEKQTEENLYLVDMALGPLELDGEQQMTELSGGQLRRAALAYALVEHPDLLLLDEPTNHLDLAGIEWLENYLRTYQGALLCVSHDRAFLSNVSNKIFWLDRGRIRVCPKGFAHYEEWSQMLLEQEARELEKREKILAQEAEWASKGISARRKRNVRRLQLMHEARDRLRQARSGYNQVLRKIELKPLEPSEISNVVAEFYNVGKRYESKGRETLILEDFSLRILRGERIGVLGNNGSGKSTFLKLLVGQISPDRGTVKLAKSAEVSYFDQKRSDLNPEETLKRTLCPNGGDYIEVYGKERHVCGYLKQFLFDPKGANDKVSTLSGGQQNRLMLAKKLANPGNVLILDEPTNDLDMDTLDMLEEMLINYKGTLIIVSHDRDFLDQTVSQLLAFEGNGVVRRCAGGYSDYLKLRQEEAGVLKASAPPEPVVNAPPGGERKRAAKLSYKLQFELDNLPKKITALEAELEQLRARLADASLYNNDRDEFDALVLRAGKAQKEMETLEARWLDLEELRENLA